MITFDVQIWQVLQFVAAVLFPVLVGLVTTRLTDPGVKAILLLALNLGAAILLELVDALQNGTEYNLGLALLTALGSFVVGVALHYGLWKPTGVAGKAEASGRHVKEPSGVFDLKNRDTQPNVLEAEQERRAAERARANEPEPDDYNRGNDRW